MAVNWDKSHVVNGGLLVNDSETVGVGDDSGNMVFKDENVSEITLTDLIIGAIEYVLMDENADILVDENFNILLGEL